MNQILGYLQPVWSFFEPGIEAYGGGLGMMFWVQFGVIAVVLALLMRSFGAILIFSVVGVIIHAVVDVVMPMVREQAAFAMPPVQDMTYLLFLGALFVGYFLAMIVLSIVKGIVFRGG
ncbi:MAG: hypothetical protein KIS81_02915 [Maricaulaceae bacterium]|nr:hypothetical protein [Maricaulaceae bacterium]